MKLIYFHSMLRRPYNLSYPLRTMLMLMTVLNRLCLVLLSKILLVVVLVEVSMNHHTQYAIMAPEKRSHYRIRQPVFLFR